MASDKIEKLIDELMNWPYDALIDFNQFGLTYEEKQELYEAIEERALMYKKLGNVPSPPIM